MVFAQESIKRMFEDHGEKTLAEGAGKKGTLIFTGTLGALRCNAEFASYGASRSSVRQLAQSLAKELSAKGIHVAVCDLGDSPRVFARLPAPVTVNGVITAGCREVAQGVSLFAVANCGNRDRESTND